MLYLLTVISERVGRTAFDMDDIKDACKDWKDGYKELEKFTNAASPSGGSGGFGGSSGGSGGGSFGGR